ncbi:MAG: calcium-binding EGF-like domain-containing protein [Bacteroidota bacterium]|nr:MAG: calcium-binding EGF-like domain-containing protein [Bacteroidota bacterium]
MLASILTIGAFSTTLFTACNPDACKDVVCQNGGTCVDGDCTCPVGYEGTNCQTLSRDKFIGVFTGSETCTVGTDNYSITCSANSDNTKFNIQNLYNQSLTAIASANGNAFTIPSQTVGSGVTAVGSGTITGNTMTVTYTVNDGVTSNTVRSPELNKFT